MESVITPTKWLDLVHYLIVKECFKNSYTQNQVQIMINIILYTIKLLEYGMPRKLY